MNKQIINEGGYANTPEIREIFMGLRKAKQDFDQGLASPQGLINTAFVDWLNEIYGIQLFVSQDGYNLEKHLEVTDEQKYMFFVLKYVS